jgi:predicted dehydrogenase
LSDKPVQLGIIGLGNWSRQIFSAVGELDNVTIARCYSRYPETREKFAEEYGCEPCDSYDAMIADPAVEGIIIMSSNVAHEDDITNAAKQGKHVFVTKPITTTVAAGKRVIGTCAENNVVLGVGHQTRRETALRKLKEVLEAGTLGDVQLVEANYSTPNGLKIEDGDWRCADGECPGGALIQIGIHAIDSLQYLLGPFRRVMSWQGSGGLEVNMTGVTATLLEFESGLKGYLDSSYVSSFSHWIKIYGSKQNAYYNEVEGLTLTTDSWEDGQVREVIAPASKVSPPMPMIVEEIEEFARCIRSGERPEIDGEAALHNLAVVLAAVESDKTGQPVDIASVMTA